MNDYEFACFFQAELERHLRETSDQDYRLNPPQALAFATLVRRMGSLWSYWIPQIQRTHKKRCDSVVFQ